MFADIIEVRPSHPESLEESVEEEEEGEGEGGGEVITEIGELPNPGECKEPVLSGEEEGVRPYQTLCLDWGATLALGT